MGRWTGFTLRGRSQRLITILCAYRVSQSSPQGTGIDTAVNQQWRHLRASQPNPKPRQQILTDLTRHIQSLRQQQHEVILMIDANESTNSDNPWTRFLTENNLHDLLALRHHSPPPNTHSRGSQRIDFIVATEQIASSVTNVDSRTRVVLGLNDLPLVQLESLIIP